MRAAVIQTTTGIDPKASINQLTRAIAQAKAEGASIAFTPEMCGVLDRDRDRLLSHIGDENDDPVLAALRSCAAQHAIWINVGSLALKDAASDDGRLVNRGFMIDDKGQIQARYDKLHLFDVDLPSGEIYRESAAYRAGDKPALVDTPIGRMGMTICYDMRFPELYLRLTNAGATVLSVPAAFTVPTGRAHWHVLLRARAIEAGAFVIAAAQTGTHEDGRATYGHSLVVDPWGEVLLDMGEAPGVGVVDLDLKRLDEVRGRVPALRHRRVIEDMGPRA